MEKLIHYEIPRNQIHIDIYSHMAEYRAKVAAVVEDTAEQAIVQAIIAAARAEGVTDLYLMDKTFILDALREKQEREKPKLLTMDELKKMNGEPVWVVELNYWAVVGVEQGGRWHNVPFVYTNIDGVSYGWDAEHRNLHCYRHRPKEVPHGK